MKSLLRRVTERVMRALLRPLEERMDVAASATRWQKSSGSKNEWMRRWRKGQAEARLLASRAGGQAASGRTRRLGARIPQHAHELQPPSEPADRPGNPQTASSS